MLAIWRIKVVSASALAQARTWLKKILGADEELCPSLQAKPTSRAGPRGRTGCHASSSPRKRERTSSLSLRDDSASSSARDALAAIGRERFGGGLQVSPAEGSRSLRRWCVRPHSSQKNNPGERRRKRMKRACDVSRWVWANFVRGRERALLPPNAFPVLLAARMGIKGLTGLINDTAPGAIKKVSSSLPPPHLWARATLTLLPCTG